MTRAATHTLEESKSVMEACLTELAKLRSEQEHANRLHDERLRAQTETRLKFIEFCRSIVDSRWFSAIVPFLLTWVALVLAWYFNLPAPPSGLPTLGAEHAPTDPDAP